MAVMWNSVAGNQDKLKQILQFTRKLPKINEPQIQHISQDPSFNILNKIADALGVELSELCTFEQEISDRKEIEDRINKLIKNIPDALLLQAFSILRTLYPFRSR